MKYSEKMIKAAIALLLVSAASIGFARLEKQGPPEISIVAVGDFPSSDLVLVKEKLAKFYKCKVSILPKIELPKSYKIKGMQRYSAIDIVRHLNRKFDGRNGKVIGLTQEDICTDRKLNGKINKNWGVIGLSLLGTKSCVVSNKRIRTNRREKLEKTTIHEIGHSLGIPHCESNSKCLMADAKGKGYKIDSVLLWVCDDCKKKIKWQ